MATKPLLSLQNNDQVGLKRYKSVTVNRGCDGYLFLDECLKYIFPAA